MSLFGLLRSLLLLAVLFVFINLGYCQLGFLHHAGQTTHIKLNAGVCWPEALNQAQGPTALASGIWQLGLGHGLASLWPRFALALDAAKATPSFDCKQFNKPPNLLDTLLPKRTNPSTAVVPSALRVTPNTSPPTQAPAQASIFPKPSTQRGSL